MKQFSAEQKSFFSTANGGASSACASAAAMILMSIAFAVLFFVSLSESVLVLRVSILAGIIVLSGSILEVLSIVLVSRTKETLFQN